MGLLHHPFWFLYVLALFRHHSLLLYLFALGSLMKVQYPKCVYRPHRSFNPILKWWIHLIRSPFLYFKNFNNPSCSIKLDVFVKHGCPGVMKVKISKSYILTPSHSQGHLMRVKGEQALDEFIVRSFLTLSHPNLKYCTLHR